MVYHTVEKTPLESNDLAYSASIQYSLHLVLCDRIPIEHNYMISPHETHEEAGHDPGRRTN